MPNAYVPIGDFNDDFTSYSIGTVTFDTSKLLPQMSELVTPGDSSSSASSLIRRMAAKNLDRIVERHGLANTHRLTYLQIHDGEEAKLVVEDVGPRSPYSHAS